MEVYAVIHSYEECYSNGERIHEITLHSTLKNAESIANKLRTSCIYTNVQVAVQKMLVDDSNSVIHAY